MMDGAYPSQPSAYPARLADIPAGTPLRDDLYVKWMKLHELQVAEWEKGKRPPVFHAYTQQITGAASVFVHISSVDGEPPFLWLSTTQYKTCRAGHAYIHRMDLVPVVEGLAARWHMHTYVVAYDFSHVLITVENTATMPDPITMMGPGETKTKRFKLTTSGDIPVIASPLRRRAMMMEFLLCGTKADPCGSAFSVPAWA